MQYRRLIWARLQRTNTSAMPELVVYTHCAAGLVAMGYRTTVCRSLLAAVSTQADLSAGHSYHYTAHKNIPKPQPMLSAWLGRSKTTRLCNSYYNSAVEHTNCISMKEFSSWNLQALFLIGSLVRFEQYEGHGLGQKRLQLFFCKQPDSIIIETHVSC